MRVGEWQHDGSFRVSEVKARIEAFSAYSLARGVVSRRVVSATGALLLLGILVAGNLAGGQVNPASALLMGLTPNSTSLNGPGNVFLTATLSGSGGTGTVSLTVADLNSDGKLDYVTANQGNNTVGVFLGNGDGTFKALSSISVACNPVRVAVGDFNGDGKPDLAVSAPGCSPGTNGVAILLGNGDGTFTAKGTLISTLANPESAVVGDFNGDGKLDLAVVDRGASTDSVFFFFGNGDGTFHTPVSVSLGVLAAANQIVAADFNKDGHLDVAVSEINGSNLVVILGNGNGTFQAPRTVALPGQGWGVAVGDFNGDGIPDLVATSPAIGGVSVFLGKGDGNFTPVNNPASGTLPTANAFVPNGGPQPVAVGDFNKDGKLDVVVGLSGINTAANVAVLLGNGAGTLKNEVLFGTADTPQSVSVGDFNRDGNLDWIASTGQINSADAGSVTLGLGRGDGTFLATESYVAGQSPAWSAVADFNRDGIPDVVVPNTGSQNISVFLGKGDGTLQPAVNIPFPALSPSFVVAGDFNNDGSADFVVFPSWCPNFVNAPLYAYLGKGDGTFQSPVTSNISGLSSCGSLSVMVTADFNGDGKLDIGMLLTTNAGPEIAIMLGNGNGTFQAPKITQAPGGRATWMSVGDLNKDGKLDVVVVQYQNNEVQIFLGNGDGTFQAPTTLATGRLPGSSVLGDFNGNGKLDLIVENQQDLNMEIYLGNGNGTFNAPSIIDIGTTPSPASIKQVGDFNLDGHLDVIFGHNDNRGVGISLLLGNGNGTFQPVQNYLVSGGSYAVAVDDFNRDGAPDVLLVDTGEEFISILLNQTPAPTHPLTVTLAGTGSGSVTSSPAGITCPSTCTANFGAGVRVTLTAKATTGSAFAGWSGACTGTGTCSVIMSAAESVTAIFNPVFPLTVTLAGTGTGKVTSSPAGVSCPSTCSANFKGGTLVTLTAAAATGSAFAGWSGACTGAGSCSVTMTAAKFVTATFNLSSGPVATLSPASLTFATQAIGTTSPTKTVTLKNTGTASLTITAIAITGTNSGDFAQTHTCGSSLAAGSSCTFKVTFKPAASGTRRAALSITDNAAGSPQQVSLGGIGTAAKLSPTSLSFGTVAIGTTSAAQTVMLTNVGTTTLTITGIAIAGTNAGEFAQTHTCGSSLAAGSSCTFKVTFKPAASGARTATLSVADNATGSPQKVTLSGVGTTAKLSPTSLSFGSVAVGTTSAAQTVMLTNVGTTTLTITSIAITGTNTGDFGQTHTCGNSLAAGTSCTISVKFKPTAKGRRTAAVSVTDNAAGSPQKVTLSGTGT
jgi:FG-GAP-like repeat/Abnormal spindle-like microcephaly-assoc'd, ASPM-SPD-2-Hydin/Divergent InlB B-repeat domain